MKFSLNWTKQFLDFELPPVEELVERIGAQLGAVDEVIDLGAKYKGIVIAKVVACQSLEGSDHLNLCLIDDGGAAKEVNRDEQGHIQVVCGAPSVRQDQLVAWLPPGTTVPATFDKNPLVLEAREIRGKLSNGMLASPRELTISDNHDGIMVLDKGQPGDDFAKTYQLDDYLIDVENKMFTHRPDCFGIIGVAREIAGILGKPFKSPDWYRADAALREPANQALRIGLSNELPGLVPRFVAIGVSGLKVGPSPWQLQSFLSRLGIRPINNVVDATNFYMLLTGQPLHAYDYDKVKELSDGDSAKIIVRNPRPGEKINLLNGKEIEPKPEAAMIATENHLLGMGGVMGGADSEVDEQTTNIILECASFDMYSIRRTSMASGLFTDAVTRFNKGQSPLQNRAVAAKTLDQLLELADGQMSGAPVDDRHVDPTALERNSLYPPVNVSIDFINQRLGLDLNSASMAQLLQNVEFDVEIKGDELTVKAPFWRTDIELREDVVEEIGRLYGYDKLPLHLPTRDLTPATKDPLLELKDKIRLTLVKAGANETLTYSFVHGNLLDKVGQDKSQAFQLSNALSPDLQYYRLSLMPSLLEKVHPNVKLGYNQFALFEIGRGHNQSHFEDNLPKENEKTALVVVHEGKHDQVSGAEYYMARKYLDQLAKTLGLKLKYEVLKKEPDYQTARPFNYERSAHIVDQASGKVIGLVGEFKASVTRNLKLPSQSAGFELSTAKLLTAGQPAYVALPRFPKITQDITLKVPTTLAFQDLYDFVREELAKQQPKNFIELAPLDIYQGQKDKEHKNVSLRLNIASYERTLTDSEVNLLLDKVAAAAKTKFGAERI